MRVLLHSIGCRLNQSETDTMTRQLLAAGHEIVSDAYSAEKVIINTCAVTAAAVRDARNVTRRIHHQNSDASIFLTGCYATLSPTELMQVPGASVIVANKDKDRLVQMVDPQVPVESTEFEQEPILRELLAGASSRSRAFVKVQDGCDNRCTFCVTTIARGSGRSRPLSDVVSEIQALAGAGFQEAVLTGVHLGSYGRDLGSAFQDKTNLHELVANILRNTDIPRLRLSSLEPWDIDASFFALWHNSRLLPHLHMPLQSGSDGVLRRMARRTSRAEYRRLVGDARAHIPHLNLSTDIMVAFPGETEAEFEESLEYVRQIGFSRLHVFAYSSRPGTAAARMPGHLPALTKKARVRRMIALGQELSLNFHQTFEGKTRDVLWESAVGADQRGLRWVGYTDNYIRVAATGPVDLFNQVTPTHLLEARVDGISGEILIRP
jgi:threonylcarbamoyladenosine tRNA methylthiotransferase MtaB